MVSTVMRGPRGYLLPVGCYCSRWRRWSGLCACCQRRALNPPEEAPATPIPIAELLIEPTRFPEQFPAVVVDPSIVFRLLRQIDGVTDGSVVTPPECAPPPVAAAEGAAVQGVDQQSGASLIVTVTRPAPSLRARVDQLVGCSTFTSGRG